MVSKKSLVLVFILSLWVQFGFSQKLDSLLKVYESNPQGEDRYRVLQALFDSYVFNDLSEAEKYVLEHQKLAKDNADERQMAQATYNIGLLINNRNNYDSAAWWYQKALKMYREQEDLKNVAKVNFGLAILDYSRGNYASALSLSDENIPILLGINPDSSLLGGDFQLRGQIELQRGNLNIALQETLRAVRIFQNTGDELRLADAYNLLGALETSLKNFQESIEYNLLASEIYQKYEDRFFQAQALNDIGNDYFYLKNYPQAIQYLQESIALSEDIGAKDLEGTAYTNWGKVFAAQLNFSEAIALLEKSISLAEQTGNKIKIIEVSNELGQCYLGLGQLDEARKFLDHALTMAKEQGAKESLSQAFFFRSQTKEKQGDPVGALEDFRSYATLKDSLLDETKSKQIQELRTLFDLEKKEHEILLLEQKAEISQLQMTLLTSGMVALTLLLGIGFYAYRQKIKKNAIEQLRINEQLEYKSRTLTAQALHLAKKNETLENLRQTALKLKEGTEENSGYQKLIRTINSDLNDDKGWATFSKFFEEVHPEFFSKAANSFPGLSPAEYRLMALIRMNLSSKEMANILMISMPGIKKARQRLRKKLGLETGDSLEEAILSL